MDNLIIIIFAFSVVIALQEILHFTERKDLYNRIMSRDLPEYKRITGKDTEDEPRKTAHDKAIDKWRNGGK